MILLRILLLPFSLLYGLGVSIRNALYNLKILKSYSMQLPVIGVGNLSVGGTGKTPHVSYLTNLLAKYYKVAILSRGYKRKTKGYRIVNDNAMVDEVGDEPLLLKKAHPRAIVAVNKSRYIGIKKLLKDHPDIDVILLDDSFQHRKIRPGISILLTDYHKIFARNFVLPSGTLREFKCGAKRADILVVTKTPKVFSPLVRKSLLNEIHVRQHQKIFFSYIYNQGLKPCLFSSAKQIPDAASVIYLFSGIANPIPLEEYLKRKCNELITKRFSDHYQFKIKDMEKIRNEFNEVFQKNKILVTTEKDLMRINTPDLQAVFRDIPLYYAPIEVELHKEDKSDFDNIILNYVEQNRRNN